MHINCLKEDHCWKDQNTNNQVFIFFFLFQIDADFLQCDDFLVGDITVDTKRHIMFATEDQLSLLQSAKRWYMDGTFKVVQKPFTQLFSIHAFIQKECMKQVPLLFVLMSRRKKKDYKAVSSNNTFKITYIGINLSRILWLEYNNCHLLSNSISLK